MKIVTLTYQDPERLTKEDMQDAYGEELYFMAGCDNCIVGIVERFGMEPIVCYDKTKVLDKLMADGMSIEEAEEFFEFNELGAWNGEYTPCFITQMKGKQQ